MKLFNTALILAFSVLSINATARQINGEDQATIVKDKIEAEVFAIAGVNSIGLTGCDSITGEINYVSGDVYCILMTTEDQKSANQLGLKFPSGYSVDGVFTWIQVIGKIVPEPRMTGGR